MRLTIFATSLTSVPPSNSTREPAPDHPYNAGSVSGPQCVCCELHMPEVLVELLGHVQHDCSVGYVAAEQELSAAIVAAFTGRETTEVAHRVFDRAGDERLEFDECHDSGELRVPVAITRLAERDVAEPEPGRLAAVDDERSDGIGPWPERPLVDLRLAELIGNFDHLPNATSSTTPSASMASVRVEPQPQLAPSDRASSSAVIPTVAMTVPVQSRGRFSRKPLFRNARMLTMVPTMPMGTLTRNSQRQSNWVASQPPRPGPTAGAAMAAIPHTPMAVPRRSGGNTS